MRHARLRQVLLLDAAFEMVLVLVLLAAAFTGLADDLALPPPMHETSMYVAVALALMAVTVLILYWATTLRDLEVGLLATGNGAGAIILAGWVGLRDDFTTSGAVFVLFVGAVLMVLATAQFTLLRRG